MISRNPSKNRIDKCFSILKKKGKKAFIAYICAGYPCIETCFEIMKGLKESGVDIIELGVPFSDPMADGVANQMASYRAIEAGITIDKIFKLICDFRKISNIPIVLFTYLNPIYIYGYDKFHKDALKSGADGVLILDLPVKEALINKDLIISDERLSSIQLISPTTKNNRYSEIVRNTQGFIYYVSREGVTGVQSEIARGIREKVQEIKLYSDIPVVVGFGISTPNQVSEISKYADGVVVGSAIVNFISENSNSRNIKDNIIKFVKPFVLSSKLYNDN